MEHRLPRKLAAILYADVAEYSRLTGEDEDATHRSVSEYLDLIATTIESHRGQVMHYAGDAVLAKFDAALDALGCAAHIQNELRERNMEIPETRRVEFRIGVNLGDVIEDRGDIYGDGVNVAARLETIAEPGGICISESMQTAIGAKLSLGYEFLGEQKVKNISQPIRAYRVVDPESGSRDSPSLKAPSDALPAVAVLPFTNISGDPEQEYFSDGLTEDIITGLSYWRAFPVIARNSTFTYKGTSVRVQEVAQELGARYVLEGSVRSAGKRIRVTAQLIDGVTGHNVWADRYDRAMEDVFDVQDEITQKIVGTVQPELMQAEFERSTTARPEGLRTWDYFLRGMALLHKYTIAANAEAREMFQKAIDLEPEYGEAWAGLGWGYIRDIDMRELEARQPLIEKGLEIAKKAVELNDRSALAHYVLGTAYVWCENLNFGIAEVEKCLELNPYLAQAHMALGNRLDLSGRSDEGIKKMERSLELNPRDPSRPSYMAFLSRAYTSKKDYKGALAWIERAVSLRPQDVDLHYRHAVCLANLDRAREAREALQRCEELNPEWLVKRSSWRPYSDDERNERFFAGFKRHGLLT